MLTSIQKACLKSKTVDEIKKAYHSDAFLSEGIGAMSGLGIATPGTHNFYPHVDEKVIAESPLSRGVQVPAVFGYSMCNIIHTNSHSKFIRANERPKTKMRVS